jgi:hypothetical protein
MLWGLFHPQTIQLNDPPDVTENDLKPPSTGMIEGGVL